MTIELKYNGSDYKIVVEPQSFTAYKLGVNQAKGDNFGKPTESAIGYFSSIGNAVKKIVQQELADTDEKVTLLQYTERIEHAYKELLKQTDL